MDMKVIVMSPVITTRLLVTLIQIIVIDVLTYAEITPMIGILTPAMVKLF